jgi:hypothetical protein
MTPEQDFANRCVGALRVFDFNDLLQLNQRRAISCGGSHVDAELTLGTDPKQGNTCWPTLDTQIKCSGTSSLRFTYLSQSGEAAAGRFYTNFSNDCTALFGPTTEPQQAFFGDEFYIQWSQRFSPEILQTVFKTGSGSPADQKLAVITAGDIPPGWQALWPNGRDWADCEKVETTVTRHWNNPFAVVYNECGKYVGLNEALGNGAQNYQNAMPAPGCNSNTVISMGGGFNTQPVPGCFNFEPDVWYTIQVGIKLGPRDRVSRRFTQSTLKMWMCKKGDPATLVIDWNPTVKGYFALCDGYPEVTSSPPSGPQWFGAIVMEPYMYQKDKTQVHDPASTWIDELIIATQRIPDPQPTTTNGDPMADITSVQAKQLDALNEARTVAGLPTVSESDIDNAAANAALITDLQGQVATLQGELATVTADDTALKAKLVNVQAAADAVEAALK